MNQQKFKPLFVLFYIYLFVLVLIFLSNFQCADIPTGLKNRKSDSSVIKTMKYPTLKDTHNMYPKNLKDSFKLQENRVIKKNNLTIKDSTADIILYVKTDEQIISKERKFTGLPLDKSKNIYKSLLSTNKISLLPFVFLNLDKRFYFNNFLINPEAELINY